MHIGISNNSELPIYQQIVDKMKEYIVDGQLKGGQLLPSIRKLAKDSNISVITTKRAYEELQRLDYITVVPGKGCYVKIKSNELVKEEILKQVEEKLLEVIEVSTKYAISKQEVQKIFDTLYEE